MKSFGLYLVCVFQSIHLSFACGGYNVELVKVITGKDNRLKLFEGYQFKVDKNCKLFIGGCLKIEQALKSALVTVEIKTAKGEKHIPFNKKPYCEVLDNFGVKKFECPFKKTGRICNKYEQIADISNIEPVLEDIKGKLNVSVKIKHGNKKTDDTFQVTFNIKKK